MVKIYKLIPLVIMISTLIGGCGRSIVDIPEEAPTIQVLQKTATLPSDTPAQPTATLEFLSELSAGLEELTFDDFIEDSYRRLLSRDPEGVLELGLTQVYEVPTDQLTNISDEYIRQTQTLESDILKLLQGYDRSILTKDQQLTYDIYAWYLTDRVKGHEFMYSDYPVNPTIFSIHLDLLQFFTDLRPLATLEDAQDYVACLSQVKIKFDQLIDGLQRREENGVVLPLFLVDWILDGLSDIAESNARSTPYYTAFESKILSLSNITPSDSQLLLKAAEEAINNSVIPGYRVLVDYFKHLRTVATNDAGIWKFPNGEEYYVYLLKHYTSTDMTVDQIHQLGLQELELIHAEMRKIFDQLGYPTDEGIPLLFNRVTADSGTLSGLDIVQGYEEIITSVDQKIGEVFDLQPGIGVIVVGGPTGGYYMPPAVDGSRPGFFYAADQGIQPKYSMTTLACHEAIPGHHYQLAIAQQLDLPSFRRGADFTAYIEGWALYAEHLVSDIGLYANDPYGDLGRLQAQAFRASRLVVDTGIHAKQWTFDEAVNFMVDNTGMPVYMMQGEVSRYISLPGQATAYYIGFTKIHQEQQRAMEELGEKFDIKIFHNALLGNGAMPLEILDRVIDSYIQKERNGD